MIKTITVTNYLGDSIKLDLARPEESGFAIESIDGLGPSKATINNTEVSTMDGGIFNSSRLSSRNIIISLIFLWITSIEEVRQLSYKYFPIKKRVTLLIETDNRLCEISGYVEANEPKIFSKQESTAISIICPDPFFYSVGNDQKTLFYGVEPKFSFPFNNNSLNTKLIDFGSIENKTEKTVFYDGDSEIGITMTIHSIGAATNISIYNTRTRELLKIDTARLAALTGSGIISGDEIIICTVKGSKSIILLRNGDYINILNCLDKNVNWFQLERGDNIFAFSAETGSNNLQFKIENKIVYEGV